MKYPALIVNKDEIEYKENPYLPISSVGTDYTTANETNLPAGSALMTDTLDGKGGGSSVLNSKGITHIIHAAPKPRSSFSTDQDFINNVVKAVQNCILLADRADIQQQIKTDTLAICLVGGGIYLDACSPSLLAEGIIRGAVNQLAKCKNISGLSLIDWEGSSQHHFSEKIRQLAEELFIHSGGWDWEFFNELKSDKSKKGVSVRVGDIRNKELHKSSVIVNAANTYVGFGGGISKAIGEETGNSGAIDQEAERLIKKFHSLIQKEGNEEDSKTSFQARFWLNMYTRPSKWATDNFLQNYYFFSIGSKTEDEINEGAILINKNHKELNKWEGLEVGLKSKYLIKFREKKQIYEVNDWLEVVDENGKFPLKNNNNKDNKTCAACGKNISNFSITKNGKDYCSHACSEKKDSNGTKLTCPKCGKQFDNLPIVKDGKNYCSKKCSGEEKNDNENKDNKSASEWQSELKAVDNEVGQVFNENKVKEWKEKGKSSFGRVENVKKLVESVKDNAKFLNLIKTKLNSDGLANFFANKTPQEVITIVKRFEYENLSPGAKENKNKKIKAYYQKISQLAQDGKLTEEQINQYLYQQAIGEIDENSIQVDQDYQKNTKPSEGNLAKVGKIIGIVSLVLVGGVLLTLFIRKRKKVAK